MPPTDTFEETIRKRIFGENTPAAATESVPNIPTTSVPNTPNTFEDTIRKRISGESPSDDLVDMESLQKFADKVPEPGFFNKAFDALNEAVTGKSRQTGFTKGAPEIGSAVPLFRESPEEIFRPIKKFSDLFRLGPNAHLSLQLLSTMKPEAIRDTALKIEGTKSFTDSKGNIFIKFPKSFIDDRGGDSSRQIFQINKPGFSSTDGVAFLAEMAMHAFPQSRLFSGKTKGAIEAGKRLIKRGLLAGSISTIREGLSKAAGSEQDADVMNVLIDGVSEPLFGGVTKGVQKVTSTRMAKRANARMMQTLTNFLDDLKEAGFTPKKTGTRFLKTQLPNGKIIDVATLLKARSRAMKPASKEINQAIQNATDQGTVIGVFNIVDDIDNQILDLRASSFMKKKTKTETLKLLEKMRLEVLSNAAALASGSNVKALNIYKQLLSDRFEKTLRSGAKSKGRIIEKVRSGLKKELDRRVPGLQDANLKWRSENEIASGLDAMIKKISKLTDGDNSINAAQKIFNPKNTSVETIRELKSVIEPVDPEGWRALMQNHFIRKGSLKAGQGADQFFKNTLPDDATNELLFEAMGISSDASKNLSFLKKAVENAKTNGNLVGRAFASAYANPFRGVNIRLLEFAPEEVARARIMAEIFFDPNIQKKVNKLRIKEISSKENVFRVMSNVVEKAAGNVAEKIEFFNILRNVDEVIDVLPEKEQSSQSDERIQEPVTEI